jgi:hypothetical protein
MVSLRRKHVYKCADKLCEGANEEHPDHEEEPLKSRSICRDTDIVPETWQSDEVGLEIYRLGNTNQRRTAFPQKDSTVSRLKQPQAKMKASDKFY